MKRAVKIACATLLACMLVPAIASGNDTSVGGAGGTVMPLSEDGIRLDSEVVQVLVYQRFAAYRVDFKFINDGAEKTLKLGFPFPQGTEEGSPHIPPVSVRAWQDGKPLQIARESGIDNGDLVEWWTHQVTFAPGTTMVRVEYYAAPTESSGGSASEYEPPARFADVFSVDAAYPYTIHTGASWAGSIGRSLVRFQLSEDAEAWGIKELMRRFATQLARDDKTQHAEVVLAYTQPEPNTFVWDFRDFEPQYDPAVGCPYDIALRFFRPETVHSTIPPDSSWGGVSAEAQQEVTASSWLRLGDYQYPPQSVFDGYPSTAWAENGAGEGVGEWVRTTFDAVRTVREIRVLPGYAKRADLFYKYNRPKTLRVDFSDGTHATLSLADEPTLQVFPVAAHADWAKVTIEDVYRGTTRNETYISEIEFGTAVSPTFVTFEEAMGLPAGQVAQAPLSAEEAAAPATAAVVATRTTDVTASLLTGTTKRESVRPADTDAENGAAATRAIFAAIVALGVLAAIAFALTRRLSAKRSYDATGEAAPPPRPQS